MPICATTWRIETTLEPGGPAWFAGPGVSHPALERPQRDGTVNGS